MAALCPGVQYGLSSQENFSGNKDLIFVKLTDSALRAIEEYIKNQNKFSSNQNATIKFLGNEGELSFPSLQNGCTSFNFSLSNATDMEGLGGSFECMQQLSSPRGSLESIGAIPHKMRIHANDDVYAATKQRMTVVEEIHKNKCTREIKPNQPDIGRKVKVKQSSNRSAIVPPSRREVPLPRDIPAKPSYQPTIPPKPVIPPCNTYANGGLGNQHAVNPRVQNKPSSMPDIARRPIKERLIHLLALRPFKKPELYERLTREGLREKKSLASILKQISCLKDNAYHLNRVLWNDVREDWPFYTESEKQILKRRKPQNLTPPGGSDGGSSGSGHSPNSTHPGSPPPVNTKRPGYFDGADGLPTKRPRISHYRKPSEPIYRSPAENISQRRPVTDSRDSSNMNPRSRERELVDYSSLAPNDFGSGMFNDKHNLSDDEQDIATGKKRSIDNHNLNVNVNQEKSLTESSNYLSPCKEVFPKEDALLRNNYEILDNIEKMRHNENNVKSNQIDVSSSGRTQYKESSKRKQENREQTRWNNPTSYPLENNPNSDNMQRIFKIENDRSILNGSMESTYYPDYLKEYTTIKDANQRKRYKECFNKYFEEYKNLFEAIDKISQYFVLLEQKMKQQDTESPGYKNIQKQIVRAYKDSKKNPKHIEVNNRFKYLHDKLSHIKRLVLEYDENEDTGH